MAVTNDGYQLRAKQNLNKEDDIWLIDHCWTTSHDLAVSTLIENIDLLKRLWKMFDMQKRLIITEEIKEKADEDNVKIIIEQTGCTKKQAETILLECNNDLIEAIHKREELIGKSKPLQTQNLENELKKQMKKSVEQQGGYIDDGIERKTNSINKKEVIQDEVNENDINLSIEQKAQLIYQSMIHHDCARSYNIAMPRPKESKRNGPLQSEEVFTCIYVNDEVGSAIAFSENPNAIMTHIIVLNVHGTPAFSLLWLNQNVIADDFITIKRPEKKIPPPKKK